MRGGAFFSMRRFLKELDRVMQIPRGCTKRPGKPFYIVGFPVASEGISQIKLNENTCHMLTKEPDRPR
jgi:hypothetical protein